jgi:hypothetical protein
MIVEKQLISENQKRSKKVVSDVHKQISRLTIVGTGHQIRGF